MIRAGLAIGLVAALLAAPSSIAAQSVPANARAVSYGKGWVCNTGYVERQTACVHISAATDGEVRQLIVRQSVTAYSGICACPYNVDRAGRRCGGRSAYSRPGGASPKCYESDVGAGEVQRLRDRYPPPRV